MFSENLEVTVGAPLTKLPPAEWTVICTDEQFWDSRLSRLALAHDFHPASSIRVSDPSLRAARNFLSLHDVYPCVLHASRKGVS
jgi:hypothetical protein